MNLTGEQLEKLVERCDQFKNFRVPPDYGYRDSLALCLVDSVQSLGVKYKSVRNVVRTYEAYRKAEKGTPETDGTAELLKTFSDLGGAEAWAKEIGNDNKTSSHAGAPLKAEAIRQAAEMLTANGITDTKRLREAAENDSLRHIKSQWFRIPGQSVGTAWGYLLMLAGIPGVKPDRMIVRFVADALELPRKAVKPAFAGEAILAAAEALQMPPTDLDHAVWDWQRQQG